MPNENATRESERKAAGLPRDAAFIESLVPEKLKYKVTYMWCTHSCIQDSRGEGIRAPSNTRYNGCTARITLEAVRLAGGQWVLRTKNEVVVHAHHLTSVHVASYVTMSDIEAFGMADNVRSMVLANATPRNICDVFGSMTGAELTTQQLANYRRGRFGEAEALEKLTLLVKRFSSYQGSRCLLLRDANAKTVGFAMQSMAQRVLFEHWGETLLMDFTHNTNNYKFNLGALMITGVSGRGVSVFDFLVKNQTAEMMQVVLQHFVRINPGAQDFVVSFVIDKDYTEWGVLARVFPKARILLCQYHVIAWFELVVTSSMYAIPLSLRKQVYAILRAAVYVKTIHGYDALVTELT